jgi:excisionase family DNA binding protein
MEAAQLLPTCRVKQAAELMGVHPKTVEDYIEAGALPAAKMGRAWVMLTKDVLALVTQQVVHQTAERMKRPAGQRRSTKVKKLGHSPEGSRTASSSGGSCAR